MILRPEALVGVVLWWDGERSTGEILSEDLELYRVDERSLSGMKALYQDQMVAFRLISDPMDNSKYQTVSVVGTFQP